MVPAARLDRAEIFEGKPECECDRCQDYSR